MCSGKKEGRSQKLLREPKRDDTTQHHPRLSNDPNSGFWGGRGESYAMYGSCEKKISKAFKRYVVLPPAAFGLCRQILRRSLQLMRLSPNGGLWHRIQSILHATVTFVMVERLSPCPASGSTFKHHYYSALLYYFTPRPPPTSGPLPALYHVKANAGFSVFIGTNAHLAGVQG